MLRVQSVQGMVNAIDNGEDKYGMPIEEAMEMFPNGCDEYSISYAFYEYLDEKYWED